MGQVVSLELGYTEWCLGKPLDAIHLNFKYILYIGIDINILKIGGSLTQEITNKK